LPFEFAVSLRKRALAWACKQRDAVCVEHVSAFRRNVCFETWISDRCRRIYFSDYNNINQRNAFYTALMALHTHLSKFSVILIAKRQTRITSNCFNDKDNSAAVLQVLRYWIIEKREWKIKSIVGFFVS